MKRKTKILSRFLMLCTTSVLVFGGVTSNASTNINTNEQNSSTTEETLEQNENVLDGKHISVSLKADKTSGGSYDDMTLRYEGTRNVGTYVYPEQITYDIIIKNYGTEDVENIKLTNTISKELLNAVDVNSIEFELEKGYYVTTSDGENVTITIENETKNENTSVGSTTEENSMTDATTITDLDKVLTIDKIKSGDSIKLQLKMNARQGITSEKNLKNSVSIDVNEDNVLSNLLNLLNGDSNEGSENHYDEDLINIGEYANVNPQMTITMDSSKFNDENGNVNNSTVSPNSTYNAGDTIEFNINVVNGGDVALYDITFQDDISEQLSNILDQNYYFYPTAVITPTNGEQYDSNLTVDGKIAVLSKLEPGEKADIKFIATIKEDAHEATNLVNRVSATAKWLNTNSNPAEYVQMELDTTKHIAESFINVSGLPSMSVTMTTDKTLEDGTAIYNEGDVVEYQVTVSNTGGKDLVNVSVTDLLSDELKESAESYSFIIDGNTFTTTLGNTPKVSSVSKTSALIDSLKAGDSLTLYFDIVLKEGILGVENISNAVNITAFYDDLSKYPNINLVQLPINEENHNAETLISILGQPSLSVKIGTITDTGANNFSPGDVIQLNLSIENTGDYDLANLEASCVMDAALTQFIESNTFSTDAVLSTTNGNAITVRGAIDSITLDRLSVGDSVTIPFTLRLKENAEESSNLKFGVKITPNYVLDDEIHEFDAVEDYTTINIVKEEVTVPENNATGLAVAIKADKTTGITLDTTTGRYVKEGSTINNVSDDESSVEVTDENGVENAGENSVEATGDVQIRTPGEYKSSEKVDYTITVTNSEDFDFYNVRIENTISEELKNVLSGDQTFILPDNGSLTSKNGAQIILGLSSVSSTNTQDLAQDADNTGTDTPMISVSSNPSIESVSDSTQAITLSKLPAKDSVEIHFTATIKESANNVDGALDSVQITGATLNSSNVLEQVPVTDLMSDKEAINVASLTSLRIAKLADKTTGVELVEGRYQGNKVTAEYGPESVIKYKITVTNLGTADTANLVVTEQPSDQLKYLSEYGKFITKDAVKTALGNDANVSIKGLTATIDKLISGDSIVLEFEVKLKSDAMDALDIPNTVNVAGNYLIGEQQYEIPVTELMTDSDAVSINQNVAASGEETILPDKNGSDGNNDSNGAGEDNGDGSNTNEESNSDGNLKSSGAKTGDNNNVILWATCLGMSLIGVIAVTRRFRKETIKK